MAFRTGVAFSIHMFVMLTGIPAIVLRCTLCMAGGTLRVGIERAGRPVRRGLAAVAADVGAAAAVEAWRAAILVIKAVRNGDFSAAVIMGCAIMAGRAARSDRTEAQHVVLGMSPVSVRCGAA